MAADEAPGPRFEAAAEHWSRYWRAGYLHSCPNAFRGNYADELRELWHELLEAEQGRRLSEEHEARWLWLAGFYAVVTIGELCLSPMGLSLVTKLSPPRLVGLTMGGWFLATAFGNNFSGFFGGIQSLMSPVSFFLLLSGLAGLVALYLRLVLPKLDATIKQYRG